MITTMPVAAHLRPLRQTVVDSLSASIRDAANDAVKSARARMESTVPSADVPRYLPYLIAGVEWLEHLNPSLTTVTRWAERSGACERCTLIEVEMAFRLSVECAVTGYLHTWRDGGTVDLVSLDVEEVLTELLDSCVHEHAE